MFAKIAARLGVCASCHEQSGNTNFDRPQSNFIVNKKYSSNHQWLVEFNNARRNPLFSFEILSKTELKSPLSKQEVNRKKTRFFAEQALPSHFRTYPKDYNDSGFDRGHMVPAADFTQSQELLDSTFTMANISPQDPELNKGSWAKLEALLRKLVQIEFEEVAVVTGPVFAPTIVSGQWVYAHKTIGTFPQLITIPTHFFKVVLCKRYLPTKEPYGTEYQQLVCAAFLMPNKPVSPESPLTEFLIKIDQLESLVGIRFFVSTLDDGARKKLDDVVPTSRDISVLLNPVSEAYGSLLLNDSKTGDSKTTKICTIEISKRAGIHHLCKVLDCNLSLQVLLSAKYKAS